MSGPLGGLNWCSTHDVWCLDYFRVHSEVLWQHDRCSVLLLLSFLPVTSLGKLLKQKSSRQNRLSLTAAWCNTIDGCQMKSCHCMYGLDGVPLLGPSRWCVGNVLWEVNKSHWVAWSLKPWQLNPVIILSYFSLFHECNQKKVVSQNSDFIHVTIIDELPHLHSVLPLTGLFSIQSDGGSAAAGLLPAPRWLAGWLDV